VATDRPLLRATEEPVVSITNAERRSGQSPRQQVLKFSITEDQRDCLRTLENFGWTLKFVRRDALGEPMAWVYDPDNKRLAVIEPDGTLDESRTLRARH
jgi:hypothetical protein